MGAYNAMGGAGYQFALINVVGVYGTAASPGMLRTTPSSAPIGVEVRAAVEKALAPSRVVWVESQAAVVGSGPMLPTAFPTAREVGAVLTIGVPDIDGGTAKVTTAMWCGLTCGTGGRFVLRKRDDAWSVTGTEGGGWIA